MINKLFSICIPTNNRIESLKEMLTDLIPKIEAYSIRIFIHDNNSTDGTEQYILELKEIYPHIIYFKSDTYRESDVNLTRVLKMSDTKYRLLLGDHYILIDNFSIEHIYKFLLSDIEYDAIILHYKGRKMFQTNDFLYKDKELFMVELGWYIGMAATTIYNEKMIADMNFENYFNTNFTQSLSVLDYISNRNFQIQYISEPTVWSTKGGVIGKSSWHDRALEIFARDWYKGINSLPNSYSKESKLKCIKNHAEMAYGFFSFKSLLLYKYAGGVSLKLVFKYIKYLYLCSNLKVTLYAIFVSLIPSSMIKYFFKEEWVYIQRVLGNMDKYK